MLRAPRGMGRRLRGAIAQRLGAAIVSGEYAPGDILSGEVALSEALDVLRNAYRDAMRVLVDLALQDTRFAMRR